MKRITRLRKIINNISKYFEENPHLFVLDSVTEQLELLIKIEEKSTVINCNQLEQIKLSWILARELDGLDNKEILYDIECAVKIEREIINEKGRK
jgi:hypothetical protein